MIKSILAVITGIFIWGLVAPVGNWLLRAAVPGYAGVEAAMNFSLAMLFGRLGLGLVSSLAAGAACAGVAARDSRAVPVAAGILLLLFLPVHYSLWSRFPAWYHFVFLASLVPMTLLGASLYRRGGAAAAVRLSAIREGEDA